MSSQFELENAIREATRMDSSINKVAWKPRKALENTNASHNISAGQKVKCLYMWIVMMDVITFYLQV